MTLKVNSDGEIVEASHNYGWDGSAWRKLPLVWGYSEQYLEIESASGVASGTQSLNLSTVPSGEIWVVSIISAWATAATIDRISLRLRDGVDQYVFEEQAYDTAYLTVSARGPFILQEGDSMRATFVNCSGGEDLHAYANGYKMLIAE
jgi:hypothetical protein